MLKTMPDLAGYHITNNLALPIINFIFLLLFFFVSISDPFTVPVGKAKQDVRQQKTTNKIQPDCTCGLIMHCRQAQGMGKKNGNKT